MNTVPTDFIGFSRDGFDYYEVTLWILIYNGGCLCSWSKSLVDENYQFSLEAGETTYLTSKKVIVSKNCLPHVFTSCFNRECELQCIQP